MCGCCGDKPKDGQNLTRRNVCCTDIIFLIIFIAFWGGMIYIAAFAINQGDAFRLVYGYDSFGNTCDYGMKNRDIPGVNLSGMDTTGLSHVFFMDVFDPKDSMEVCVKECPSSPILTKYDLKNFYDVTGSKLCRYDIDPEDYTSLPSSDFGIEGPCPKLPIYPTANLLWRCLPDPDVLLGLREKEEEKQNVTMSEIRSIIDFLNADDIFRKVLSDLYSSWREILVMFAVAVAISFAMVLLIRFIAAVLVWVIVILASVGSIAGTAFLWWTYYETRTKISLQEKWELPLLDVDVKNETAFMWFSIIATVLTVILLIVIIVMRKRLQLVVALFHEAGNVVMDQPWLLVQPIWTGLILIAFVLYWIAVLAYISTAEVATANGNKTFNGVPSVTYTKGTIVKYMWWYHLIGLIWTSEFILACQQFVIGGAVALWFFTREKSIMSCAVCKATSRLILHHIGSVAFGAFIITLVKIPRYILMYIEAKTMDSENSCAKCCRKCCICCLWCLEKVLKFLNANAYAIIAMEGKSFCGAAQRALSIITSNVLRVAAINSVGAFVLFLGKVGVMAATGAIATIWFKRMPEVHFFAVPVAIVTLFSLGVAHCFFTVYEMIVDTLLLCFCEDSQLNDGSEGREYFMSSSLMKFVDKADRDTVDGSPDPEEGGKLTRSRAESYKKYVKTANRSPSKQSEETELNRQ